MTEPDSTDDLEVRALLHEENVFSLLQVARDCRLILAVMLALQMIAAGVGAYLVVSVVRAVP